jgi:hypothetical protein
MSSNLGEIVAQLNHVRDQLAIASVRAQRAKADADQAYHDYEQAAQGTKHPRMQQALHNIRTAGDKSAKVARLFDQARTSFGAYLKKIAPGSVSDDDPTSEAMPTGERLAKEAADRQARAARYHRKAVEVLADKEGDLKKFEDKAMKSVALVKDRIRPGDTVPIIGTPARTPAAQPKYPPSHNPISDAVLAIAGVTLALHAGIVKFKRNREKKRADDDSP